MFKFLCVATGGALGAAARYGVSSWLQNIGPAAFPWGTLFVNVAGSFAVGVLFGISDLAPVTSTTRLFVAVGFLGAFTTFSTYSFETLSLFRDKQMILGLANIGLNNAISLLSVFGAYFLSRSIIASLR